MLLLDIAGIASLLFESTREIAVKGLAEIVVAILSPIPLAWKYFDTLLVIALTHAALRNIDAIRRSDSVLLRTAAASNLYEAPQETLDRIDWLFGDLPGKAVPDFGTRLFGLAEPAHVWTVASLDRCLLFALFTDPHCCLDMGGLQ